MVWMNAQMREIYLTQAPGEKRAGEGRRASMTGNAVEQEHSFDELQIG